MLHTHIHHGHERRRNDGRNAHRERCDGGQQSEEGEEQHDDADREAPRLAGGDSDGEFVGTIEQHRTYQSKERRAEQNQPRHGNIAPHIAARVGEHGVPQIAARRAEIASARPHGIAHDECRQQRPDHRRERAAQRHAAEQQQRNKQHDESRHRGMQQRRAPKRRHGGKDQCDRLFDYKAVVEPLQGHADERKNDGRRQIPLGKAEAHDENADKRYSDQRMRRIEIAAQRGAAERQPGVEQQQRGRNHRQCRSGALESIRKTPQRLDITLLTERRHIRPGGLRNGAYGR